VSRDKTPFMLFFLNFFIVKKLRKLLSPLNAQITLIINFFQDSSVHAVLRAEPRVRGGAAHREEGLPAAHLLEHHRLL
jgi:hypothetical protein